MTELRSAFIRGNRDVFEDIFWQFMAYKDGGLAAIQHLHETDQFGYAQYAAWKTIEEGRLQNKNDLVWDGNRLLLEYEQKVTLQDGIYDKYAGVMLMISRFMVSPIPGDETTFWEVVPGGDIAAPDDRWEWIATSMLPFYRDLATKNAKALKKKMEQILGR